MAYTIKGISPSLNSSGKTGSFQVSTKPASLSYQNTPAKKKKVNYNPREISAQILRAAKSTAASQVLVRAKGKTAVLERMHASGQYDDTQLRRALAHARRMVRCARMKVNHLVEEEGESKRSKKDETVQKQEKKREVKRRVQIKKQKLIKDAQREFEKMQRAQQQKAREAALDLKRRRHRDKEREKIFEAEMKYLQGDTGDDMPRSPVYQTAAAVFEMSERLVNLEMQMQQVMQEAEQEMQQEAAASESGVQAADSAAAGMDAAAPVQAEAGAAVDLSV